MGLRKQRRPRWPRPQPAGPAHSLRPEEARLGSWPLDRFFFLSPSLFPLPVDVAKAPQLLGSLLPAFQGLALGVIRFLGWREGDCCCYSLPLPTKPVCQPSIEPPGQAARQCGLPLGSSRSNCPSRKNVSLTELFWNSLVISSLGETTQRP